jgi:murein L,D-transpeptidase YafK
MRRTLLKQLVSSILPLAGAIILSGCEDSTLSPSIKASSPIPQKTLAQIEAIGSSKNAPVLIRAYKKESELEIWKMKPDGHYAFLKAYPMCRWSGQLGPKVKEGDRQVPEGFYSITPARMNPNSAYYLSFDIGYPNALDRALGHTGGSIMVHGVCSSAGCFSMTDEQIAEIYAIVREAFAGGQRSVQMQSYPFRMTAENFAKYRLDPNVGFWRQLKEGSDNFEVTKQEVAVGVCGKHYVFNATSALGTQLDALSPCPPLKRDEAIQRSVSEKQKGDDATIASLAAQGVRPVRTVYADGGQHPAFSSRAIAGVSRPEALEKAPVDIALDEGKTRRPRVASAGKSGNLQPVSGRASDVGENSTFAKSAEPVILAAASAPETEKPLYASLLSRLWGAKVPEVKAETAPPAPEARAAPGDRSSFVPLPPRRNETSSAGANGGTTKPQNAVAAPVSARPQAALPPAESRPRDIALVRQADPAVNR